MRVAFAYVDEEMVRKIITSFIRPVLEYAAVVWSPHLKKHIMKIEKVQRAATRWVPSLRDLSYEERLDKLQLPTLEERRKRGDMIMLYKCDEGKEKVDSNEYIIHTNHRQRNLQVAKPLETEENRSEIRCQGYAKPLSLT